MTPKPPQPLSQPKTAGRADLADALLAKIIYKAPLSTHEWKALIIAVEADAAAAERERLAVAEAMLDAERLIAIGEEENVRLLREQSRYMTQVASLEAEIDALRAVRDAAGMHGLCHCEPRPVGDGRVRHSPDCDWDEDLRAALEAAGGKS